MASRAACARAWGASILSRTIWLFGFARYFRACACAAGLFAAVFSILASTDKAYAAVGATLRLTSTVNPSLVGQATTLRFVASGGSGTPTGVVSIDFGDGTPPAPFPLAGGFAQTTHTYTVTGNFVVTATYSGDGTYFGDFAVLTQFVPATSTPSGSAAIHTIQSAVTTSVANTSAAINLDAIDAGISSGFSNGETPLNLGPGGGFINFAGGSPVATTASRVEDAYASLAYAGSYKAPISKSPPRLEREWSAWADIRGAGSKASDPAGKAMT